MDIKPADITIDKEQDNEVLITKITEQRADEYIVKEGRYGDQSVYDFNSRYGYVRESDYVVEGVYVESMPFDPREKDLEDHEVRVIARHECKVYAFPHSRLERQD